MVSRELAFARPFFKKNLFFFLVIFCPVSVAETNKLRAPCPVVGPQRYWSCCRGRSSCIAGSSTTAEDVRVSDVLVGRQWKCPHVLAFLPPSAYVFYSLPPPPPPRLRDSCPTQALARGATQTPSLASWPAHWGKPAMYFRSTRPSAVDDGPAAGRGLVAVGSAHKGCSGVLSSPT